MECYNFTQVSNMKSLRKWFAPPKFYFLAVVPLLLATALIRVPCPVCHGVGTISESQNMDDIYIMSVDSMIFGYTKDACSMYVLVKSRPQVYVSNRGEEVAKGWLKMDLIDIRTEQVLAVQFLAIEVSANSFSILNYPLAFGYYSAEDPGDMDIKASILNDNAPDIACDGHGTVPLNAYPLINAFKERLVQEVTESQEFRPDPREGTEEWHYMMED